jgi:hypothetical protein
MNRATRLSQLSPARQQLVRFCHALNYGVIRSIEVKSGDPVLNPPPSVLYDWRLDTEERPRPEAASRDFELRQEVTRMLDKLDQIGNGWIEKIEVRAGLPRRMTIEVPLQEVAR